MSEKLLIRSNVRMLCSKCKNNLIFISMIQNVADVYFCSFCNKTVYITGIKNDIERVFQHIENTEVICK